MKSLELMLIIPRRQGATKRMSRASNGGSRYKSNIAEQSLHSGIVQGKKTTDNIERVWKNEK